MERDEIIRRADALFASDGWPVVIKVLKDIDDVAIATLRAQPDSPERAAMALACNEQFRNTLRIISRLVSAVNAGVDIDDPDVNQDLPETPDIFDA